MIHRLSDICRFIFWSLQLSNSKRNWQMNKITCLLSLLWPQIRTQCEKWLLMCLWAELWSTRLLRLNEIHKHSYKTIWNCCCVCVSWSESLTQGWTERFILWISIWVSMMTEKKKNRRTSLCVWFFIFYFLKHDAGAVCWWKTTVSVL